MLYKALLVTLLGFNGIVSAMVLGNRETTEVARSEEIAAIPPVIIGTAPVVDAADE
ncbi:hypothetical protein F4677DRAFT_274620 [Hypoxylon crocopeplum]|nr:hypothetical protein F4677DRAFT_274620 [Hypoxylon crocopeplum]